MRPRRRIITKNVASTTEEVPWEKSLAGDERLRRSVVIEPIPNRMILLVEDELPWQTMLTNFCQVAGFRVTQAFDAIAALHHLRGTEPLPTLAIIDLELRSSVLQQDYAGLQLLTALRDRGIYTIVVSGHIPNAQDVLMGRPEIRRLVDKAHFTADENFGRDVFAPWVCEAMAYAEAAQHAEGQRPEQLARLHRLSWSPDDQT